MIPIQVLPRESFIRQRGNLVRELRHFPEGVFKPVPVELGSSGRKMNGVFEQRGGIGFESAALSGAASPMQCTTSSDWE